MPEARISLAQRIMLRNLAEVEVMRFAHDHARWHKHIHNVELDAAQVLKAVEMDRDPNTLDISCRRTGKTFGIHMYQLKALACHADQELGIVSPREAQSIVTLNYGLEAIRRSPILTAWLDYRSGRKQMADTYYQFANRSKAKGYGVYAQVDGSDFTMMHIDEIDDQPQDRLFSRFLLAMIGNRRAGAAGKSSIAKQIRISGVYKGATTLSRLENEGTYHKLISVDIHLAQEMGILNAEKVATVAAGLSKDEYIRQCLCINVSSKNLIWESKVREAMQMGLKADLQLAEPIPGARYKKRGLLAMGYDAAGHGEDPHASRHALVVVEQIGNFTMVIFARQWSAGADDMVVKRDLLGYWEYFRPDYAMGDAYGVGMLTQLNDELYANNLTDIDRRAIGDGQSTASTWPLWAFSPIRFEGMVKHSMFQALRAMFHNGQAGLPFIDDADMNDINTKDYRDLLRQIPNMKSVPTKASYSSYRMAQPKLGDDLVDAMAAAVWGLVTRGAAQYRTVILMSQSAPLLLPTI